MKHIYSLFFVLALFSGRVAYAQDPPLQPNREFRAVWVSTVFKLDWPKANDQQTQKNELIKLFDEIKAANQNAVLLQVRTESDAIYNSSKEPWSRYLTGVQGQDPGYDPLAFAIEEAHKRGLELHAWINPFRVNASTTATIEYSQDHISNTRPEWMLEYSSGSKIINPGIPEARQYVASVVEEIVQNYAVDGIHFDDYFYSYSGTTTEDAETYAAHGEGFTDVGDWRRHNINETIRLTYETIKTHKPQVRFGVSPFGIWKSGTPEGIVGMSAYSNIYADALQWLDAKTVDYITPQLYWPIGGQQDFRKLLVWWAEQAFAAGRHLYAGHTLNEITSPGGRRAGELMNSIGMMEEQASIQGTGKDNTATISAQTAHEVLNQIAIVREHRDKNALGSVFFRASFLTANPHGFTDLLKQKTYIYPAAPPVMEWIEGDQPAVPQELSVQLNEATGDYVLSWSRNAENTHDFKRYLLYSLDAAPADAASIPNGSVRALTTAEEVVIPTADLPFGTTYWVVTELGTANHQSELSNVVTIENNIVPVFSKPLQQQTVTTDLFARFEWESQPGIMAYHYQWASDEQFTDILQEDSALAPTYTAKLFNNLRKGSTYYMRIRAQNASGWSDWSQTYKVTVGGVTAIEDSKVISKLEVFPVPSESDVLVDMRIIKPTKVTVDLISLTGGNKVRLVDEKYFPGTHQLNLSKQQAGAGFFIMVIRLDDYQQNFKVIFQ
jgi:uncharacterized lipoprotein YddW (UPF0748 family)